MKISVQILVQAPIEKVWLSYTTPEDIVEWNTASDDWHTTSSTVDLKPGGAFSSRMEAKDGSVSFDFEGTYTRVIQNELIEYVFGDRSVTVHFNQQPEGVLVCLEFDSESEHPAEQQKAGWQAILGSFARHVTSK